MAFLCATAQFFGFLPLSGRGQGVPEDELNTETQLPVRWHKGWACSTFAKCFPRLAVGTHTETVPLKQQWQMVACLLRQL